MVAGEFITYQVDQIRKSLIRAAELAEVDWRPRRDSKLEHATVVTVRIALDAGHDWGGQLIRQRDHVMLMVGYIGGLRRSELTSLTIGDINTLRRWCPQSMGPRCAGSSLEVTTAYCVVNNGRLR